MLGDKAAPTEPSHSQNLASLNRIEVERRQPPEFYKAIAMDALAILFAAAFGFSYYRYLTGGIPVWAMLVVFTLFGVMAALQVFLAKHAGRTFGIIVLETLGVVGFFWRDDWRILAINGAIVLIFLAWGYLSARARIANSINIPFFGAASLALGKFTTGLLIFMVLIYAPQLGGNPLLVSQKSFRNFFDWTSGVVNDFYPNLSLGGSFGGFTESFAKMELTNNPEFQNLTPAQQNAAVAQTSQQIAQNLTANLPSSSVASSSATSDAFYNIIQGMMNAWQTQSDGWFNIGWAAVIFIALRGLGIIFIWIAEFFALIVYELLLATGFIKTGEEMRTRETVGY